MATTTDSEAFALSLSRSVLGYRPDEPSWSLIGRVIGVLMQEKQDEVALLIAAAENFRNLNTTRPGAVSAARRELIQALDAVLSLPQALEPPASISPG